MACLGSPATGGALNDRSRDGGWCRWQPMTPMRETVPSWRPQGWVQRAFRAGLAVDEIRGPGQHQARCPPSMANRQGRRIRYGAGLPLDITPVQHTTQLWRSCADCVESFSIGISRESWLDLYPAMHPTCNRYAQWAEASMAKSRTTTRRIVLLWSGRQQTRWQTGKTRLRQRRRRAIRVSAR